MAPESITNPPQDKQKDTLGPIILKTYLPNEWFLARLEGSGSYECPSCGCLNSFKRLNVKHPKHRCKECRVGHLVGLAVFANRLPRPVPNNGGYSVRASLQPFSNMHQRIAGREIVTSVSGRVRFRCRNCDIVCASIVKGGQMSCVCGQTYGICLQLWKAVPGSQFTCPSDWILSSTFQRVVYGELV